MGSIAYDSKSGVLERGVVWEVADSSDLQAAMEMDRVWGNWTGHQKQVDRRDCPNSRAHRTGSTVLEVSIEIFGGGKGALGDFLPLANHGFTIISSPFAERLRQCGLKGFATRKGVIIDENQSGAKDPEFLLLDVTGKGGYCRRWRVKDAPNVCPYCGREPIVCDGCGWCSEYGCPGCEKEVTYVPDRPEDADGKKLLCERHPQTLIVEAKDWDGSDWFSVEGPGGGWFVNRRAKDWFERVHALDMRFKPALLNTAGMDRKRLGRP